MSSLLSRLAYEKIERSRLVAAYLLGGVAGAGAAAAVLAALLPVPPLG